MAGLQLKFSNGDSAKITGTNSTLDGTPVQVVGVGSYDVSTSQTFYVICKTSGEVFDLPFHTSVSGKRWL